MTLAAGPYVLLSFVMFAPCSLNVLMRLCTQLVQPGTVVFGNARPSGSSYR